MLSLNKLFTNVAGAVPRLASVLGLVAPTLTTPIVTLVDGAAVAINAALGGTFVLTCANNNARVFGVPTNGVAGQRITVTIINTSGGNLTVTTFNASIKQPALTLPATATQREYYLQFDGTQWLLQGFAAANVPN